MKKINGSAAKRTQQKRNNLRYLLKNIKKRNVYKSKDRKVYYKNDSAVDRIKIIAPRIIGLDRRTTHAELTKFLVKLRRAASSGEDVLIDFSAVEKVYSCGTLLLLAEIDNSIRKTGASIKCNYPRSENVEKVFQQIGLFDLLGKEPRKSITKNDHTVVNWRSASGTNVEMEVADAMFKDIKLRLPKGYRKIIRGVQEAITNTAHHAYIDSRNDGLPESAEKRWWAFSEVLDGWLHVVICDLGVGIDRSLPKTWGEFIDDILSARFGSKKKEIELTKKAFILGRSRTKQSNRGKGLKDIKNAAQNLNGRLRVFSNSVGVGYDFTDVSNTRHFTTYHKLSILGTVVLWSVPIVKINVSGEFSESNKYSIGF